MRLIINGTVFEIRLTPSKKASVKGDHATHYVDGKRVSRDDYNAIKRDENDKAFEAKYGA